MAIRFLAIDGFNLIRRIFEARQAANEEDLVSVVNAARGSIQKALRHHKPTHCAVVLELHDKTWRHLLYPDYKANRSPTPPLLLNNLDLFREGFREIGVACCDVDNYEADDVIATIAAVVSAHGGQVVILSTDKIFLQLINDNVGVFDHFNEVTLDAKYVESHYQVSVDQFVDYLTLVGDRSNNVKGVPGVGEKTAINLLSEFRTVDSALQKKDNPKVSKLIANTSEITKCRQLVSLKTDVELGANIKSFRL